ncbi:MAG: phosphatase PAP2-related protein [Parcubacteria group bacterium]
MKKIASKYKYCWKRHGFRYAVFSSLVLLAASLTINHFTGLYANMKAGNYVNDILLDNLPVMDVDGLLNYGVELFFLFVMYCVIVEPKRAPFTLKSIALFYLIRSVSITLTHLGPYPVITPIDPNNLLATLISGNDFFFSAHTGVPFLVALIFWDEKLIRYIAIAASITFGSAVILGHLHYSIDVFAAFFITYTIFHIAMKIFSREYKLFKEE